ncbi:LOW QUALITY PROTEIN: interleukin 12 receptor, beta 2a, like [Puntigrus tetrazona]|uniref:LOW QUALITY PROTEIN: interleukin 12 receptor, beta 2a, like n=1 Tax=Puntigrus tetrazona TaxID=1606681 RepID=UPI001C892220|nr:LOW QUALITY PROTEIN: interleukin 12 receptor, beta 2a, like [Puntigrus tetrazona]
MARRAITVTLLCLWICSRVSCEVDVNCWWNEALAVGHNVSVLCHMSSRGRTDSCGLCQLYVIILGHRHEFPSTCANTKETFSFSIAAEHRESVRCLCNRTASDGCSVTVRGGYPPSPPSPPDCAIEDLEDEDIYCSWSKSNEPTIPTVYTLHWKDYDGKVKSTESSIDSAVINRRDYMKSTDITAWVTAKNELGSARSERSFFNTGHIKRPDTPYNINLTSESVEFSWDMDCDTVGYLDKSCQVQYRAHDRILDWIEVDDCQVMFVLKDPQPFTQYSFRVRCHCGYEERVMSNWSSVYSIRTPPAAPVGQLDVWSDCGPNSDESSCNVYWKEMPPSQARGEITNYIVTVKLKNGTEVKQQVRPWRDAGGQSCRQLKYYLKPGVVGVFVSANTSMGTSDPTCILFAERGPRMPEVNLSVIGEIQALRVSWSIHPHFSESVLEYVVQHVSVVPDSLCLNWVRVKRTRTSVTLTGDFWNYTAYNVSLFAVFNNHSTFLKSAIAYTLEGVPPKVSQISVKNITYSSATLVWSPIPVNESKGVVLHYLVGVKETGSNISSHRTSVQLSELQPAQLYHVWVSAVSAAGEGDKLLATFSTSRENSNDTLLVVLIMLMSLVLFVFVFMLVYKPTWCFVKIPDPINSKTFKHMNFQHAWPRFCSPSELNIKISELEIIEKLDRDTPAPQSETEPENAFIDMDPQHFELPNGLDGTNEGGGEPEEEPGESNGRSILKHERWAKEYSEMVDTDEEKDGADEEEWWDQQCVSDYERHFLPSVAAN